MKRHPKAKEILVEMEIYAKSDEEVFVNLGWVVGNNLVPYFKRRVRGERINEKVIHFIPSGCKGFAKKWMNSYTYCARPGVGKVIKHKIGNCPLAKEAKE